MADLVAALALFIFGSYMYRKVKHWDDLNDPPTGAWA